MSGSLRVVSPDDEPRLHDHVDIEMQNGPWLRYNDPRRFGSFHFADNPTETHWLLNKLGVEPLGNEFSGDYLLQHRETGVSPSKTSSWTVRLLWA